MCALSVVSVKFSERIMSQTMDTFTEMWQTLFEALNKTFVGQQERELEVIVKMIRTSLVYESPGLFPAIMLSAEDRERLEACNFWLIHKLFHLLAEERLTRYLSTIIISTFFNSNLKFLIPPEDFMEEFLIYSTTFYPDALSSKDGCSTNASEYILHLPRNSQS